MYPPVLPVPAVIVRYSSLTSENERSSSGVMRRLASVGNRIHLANARAYVSSDARAAYLVTPVEAGSNRAPSTTAVADSFDASDRMRDPSMLRSAWSRYSSLDSPGRRLRPTLL